jgi:hypothetical protein
MRRPRSLTRVSVGDSTEATGMRTPDERDFMQHLETKHHIPASVLDALPEQALADFHEAEHASPLWTTGPHHP